MKEITAKKFKQEIATGKVIVDFYGVGCSNCRVQTPILQQLAQDYPEIKFLQVNVDLAPSLVKRFNITALPTLLMVKNGHILLPPLVGLKPRSFLEQAINDLLN